MARKQHQVRKTLLIVGEGDSEEAFLKHLRELYCSGGAGVGIRPAADGLRGALKIETDQEHAMTISSAIHDRHLLSFTYDGFPRVVEPNCCGTDKKGLGA